MLNLKQNLTYCVTYIHDTKPIRTLDFDLRPKNFHGGGAKNTLGSPSLVTGDRSSV